MRLDNLVEAKKGELADGNEQSVNKGGELTVNSEMLGVLMNNLTNLYSDPRKAAFRETLANAIDSHINLAKNVEDFVEVTLPGYDSAATTSNRGLLTIQDRGVGMSREVIINNFLSYGGSTKTGNNNEAGGFGYGGKSPLAAASSFTVVSVKDGLRNSFTVTKDMEDSLSAPKFEWSDDCIEGPVETDEPNGVAVSYSVPFVRNSYYPYNFTSWSPSVIDLIGVPADCVRINEEVVVQTVHNAELFNEYKYEGNTVGWVAKDSEDIRLDNNHIYVHVGNVVYEVDLAKLDNLCDQLAKWDQLVVINVPHGTVDMIPSRDNIRYTPRTVETLNKVIAQFVDSFRSEAQNKVNATESALEASLFVSNLLEDDAPVNFRELTYRNHGIIMDNIRAMMSKISAAAIKSARDRDPSLVLIQSSYKSGRSKNVILYSESARPIQLFNSIVKAPVYIHDAGLSSAHNRIARNWEMLSQFSSQKDKHDKMSHSRKHTVVTPELLEDSWAALVLSGVETLENSLKSARKARTAHNDANGIGRAVRPPRNTALPSKKKISFVTVKLNEDKSAYTLTPYVKATDGNLIGEHYILTVSSNLFSVGDFQEQSKEGPTKLLSKYNMRAILQAESEGREVVLRTTRQSPVKFEKTLGFTPLSPNQFASKFQLPIPDVSKDEVIARIFNYCDTRSSSNFYSTNDIFVNHLMVNINYYHRSNLSSLRQLVQYIVDNEIEAPESLSQYVGIATSSEILLSSPLNAWEREVENSNVYSLSSSKNDAYESEKHVETHREHATAWMQEVIEVTRFLRIAYDAIESLNNISRDSGASGQEARDKIAESYKQQIAAILSVIK